MKYLSVGSGADARKIAFLHANGSDKDNQPGLFWLGGYLSDMQGSKALAIAEFGQRMGIETTRFDYSGHGKSEGEFAEGTISDWLQDSLEVFEKCTHGPQIVIGSSMGGWLAFLLNKHLRARGIDRVGALIVIAPAIDMTQDLMRQSFSASQLAEMEQKGFIERPSDYDEPYIVTRKLIEDGVKHLLFNAPIRTHCPVHILQGAMDTDVPPAHTLKLVSRLLLDPVSLSLVPDGDHSLSREEDLALLQRTIIQARQGIA